MYKLKAAFFSDTSDKPKEEEGDCGRIWYQAVKSPGSQLLWNGMQKRGFQVVRTKISEWAPLTWLNCLWGNDLEGIKVMG